MSLSSSLKPPEGAYRLKVDFLDTKGAVVASKDTTVTTTLERVGRFKIESPGANIAAFRYIVANP
jgi:hypothetical protein